MKNSVISKTTKSILTVKNLCKKYDTFYLDNIGFELEEGTITGFIGRNGAGKSTTIKLILNIIKFDKGEVFYRGEKFCDKRIDIKRKIGYVGEHQNFYENIKIKNIYKFVKGVYKESWNDEKFKYYINSVFDIDLNKKMKELSKGMKTKFLIALALSHEPELLLLDEPTSGLDPLIREEVLEVLYDCAKKQNMTIFFSSHITEDIEKIAERIIYIDNGKILLDCKKKEIHVRYKKINIEQLDKEAFQELKSIGVINKDYILFDVQNVKKDILNKYKTEKIMLDEMLIYLRR
ncbi:hypothetical protein BBF96_13740 [Anoxybacter fermentans]|uniref:ABC transporter domain-containing protein n=1 Tax=Anoxybacter fermentans TaxID=1323375 RepID=A0A3S9T163_9FIRM|nr:ABC transporter ATP-binding protein [Anoxybacter fermentans]AZR74356.1 hypothetical protein BBF96_13740 [Anoxybacter fermentans]